MGTAKARGEKNWSSDATYRAGSGLGRSGAQASGSGGQTLAISRSGIESLAELAHDARNMVTALGLYCDLLQEPGVLASSYLHYGNELRLVAAASRRLVEKLVALDSSHNQAQVSPLAALQDPGKRAPHDEGGERSRLARRWDMMPAIPIDDLAIELLANRSLLAALAGPSITLTVATEAGELPVWLTGEDLTRVLVNLVKNAAEAMSAGGEIQLNLTELPAASGASRDLSLTIEDNGPGIPAYALDKIFEAGFSTQSKVPGDGGWPASHRGLGLSITRSIIEKAGGRIVASNHAPDNRCSTGARMAIELPVRTR
ncbi:MAG: sensor histidine kinase [Terracidiphilus sp.]